MTDLVVQSIVSSREFGTIFAGRLGDGSVVRVKAANATMLGRPTVGEVWSVEGDFREPDWGRQIDATRAVRAVPSGRVVVDYLSGCVAGIGPARAERLWRHFQDRLPEALDIGDVDAIAAVMDPARPVLGPRLAAALLAAWKNMGAEARLVEWLAAVGVTDLHLARRVHALLGAGAPAALQANPYCLVPLLDWKRVDELGRRLLAEAGHSDPDNHPHRLVGAADAVIKEVVAAGWTAIFPDDFRRRLALRLKRAPDDAVVATAIEFASIHKAVLEAPDGLLRAPGCAVMESAVVARLRSMAVEPLPVGLRGLQQGPDLLPDTLSEDQSAAVCRALLTGFAVIRGGAGTGKTFVTRTVCDVWERAGGKLLLAALAGKAALRLSRSTGRLARTVFRTLAELDERQAIEAKLASGDVEGSERGKLETKLKNLALVTPDTLVVCDESSMLDLPSVHGLLRRMPQGSRLLMVGDERQLPPVGFGLIFHRLVHDDAVTATLTTVHRQSSASSIPAIAGALRLRQMPDLPSLVDLTAPGVTIAVASGREAIADRVVALRTSFAADADIMVVTPVNDGPCGVAGLNRRLHDEYLRTRDLQQLRGPLGDLFSPGEPVLHTVNNYQRGLFNGSLGTIQRINRAERSLTAVFDDEEHVFAADDLVDLTLGYALTCHRAQGSEADHVVVALPESRLLDPSWIYTAVTRARRSVVVVGQVDTIRAALGRPFADEHRLVGLRWT
jgi:exodeoxyribonuclease V alpha subunit